jgi:transcriptional regulator with XRE-family HTH domain
MFYHFALLMHPGKIIKKLRVQAELTQQQLAEKINKTKALVSHVENTGKVNYYTLQQIATVLNTSVEFIQNYDEKNIPAQKTTDHLPKDYELIKQENKLLKEQILFLRKQNTQLIAAMSKK